MTTTTTTAAGAPESSNLFQTVDHHTATEASKQEIQAAIAKAIELRSLHAALLQSNSPSHLRLPAVSPLPRHASQHSAQDYPVFTPSYNDVPRNKSSLNYWDETSTNRGVSEDLRFLSGYKNPNTSSRILLPPELTTIVPRSCPSDDQNSVTNLKTSPRTNYSRSRRNSLSDFGSVSSSNKCKPAMVNMTGNENGKHTNLVVPMTDSHLSVESHSKPKSGKGLSWLFPRLNKKKQKKSENSPNWIGSDEASLNGSGIMSMNDGLRKELAEANERRDAALMEVSEMKSSIVGLQEKLEYLENYCEELKKALSQAMQQMKSPSNPRSSRAITRGKTVDLNDVNTRVSNSNEVMVEAFTQMVSESRLSVTRFCKTLVAQADEGDTVLLNNLNSILRPLKLSLNSKYSKAVLCHLEAVINQSLYQDFENCVFQKNGSPKLLDPQQEREARFSSFNSLKNLSWTEVTRKGTKCYSEEFSRFCDEKMSAIVTSLNWAHPWPEQLLQAFFVAAKCVWLMHSLAFSFTPAFGILRVEENRSFDGWFMEDVFTDHERAQNPTRVKVMVTPGFYMRDGVLKCKVLCRYKTVG